MQVLFSPSRQVELLKVAFDFRAVHPRNSKASSWPNLLGRLQWILGGIAGAAVKQGKCIDNYLHHRFEAPNGSGFNEVEFDFLIKNSQNLATTPLGWKILLALLLYFYPSLTNRPPN